MINRGFLPIYWDATEMAAVSNDYK
jgi:hypothetical protein